MKRSLVLARRLAASPRAHVIQRHCFSTSTWRDWFPDAAYRNAWTTSTTIGDRLDVPEAEMATRHLLQLLQEQHRSVPRSDDRATLERCNHVLEQLAATPNESTTAKAERALAILSAMQLYQDAHASVMELPLPNRTTYQTVLTLLAAAPLPQHARAVVEHMDERYRRHGDWELKPHAFHWNCVLLAYEQCQEWDKAAAAFGVFMTCHREGLTGPSSFLTMLRICAHKHVNEKAGLLGANLAVKLWQDTVEPGLDMDLAPHFFVFFLQAIRRLPQGRLRDEYFEACMDEAIRRGKVNPFLWQEFIVHNVCARLYEKYLRPYASHTQNRPPAEAAQIVMEYIPKEWHANVKPVKRKDGTEDGREGVGHR